jgi:hypothetical protein
MDLDAVEACLLGIDRRLAIGLDDARDLVKLQGEPAICSGE